MLRLMRISRQLSVALLLTGALVLGACGEDSTVGSDRLAPARGDTRAELEHIHGLGVDPGSGGLYVATHYGLFRAAEDQTTLQRAGSSRQDIMGFSVVGRRRFIGSGHPDPSENQNPNLGLIESRDGGRSWRNISLLGEADFHVLESAGSRVYGFDGTQGRLMVSSDGGRSWQQRRPPAGVFGLAIDPANRDRVVVSTERGLFSSTTAGESWRPVDERLAGLLAWPRPKQLYLIDGQGQVQLSRDGGRVWQVVGDLGGQPAAFIASGTDLYAALGDGSVKRSTDGGRLWTVRATP